MKVGVIDVDRLSTGKCNFPNLALMKISAYHKERGDTVTWCDNPLERFDVVYQSKVFDDTYTKDIEWIPNADEINLGGTGYSMTTVLPDEIEHHFPDYSLYPIVTTNTAYGFLTRGCPRGCGYCIVAPKEGRWSHKVADLSEFWNGERKIVLIDPNLLACCQRVDLLLQLRNSGALVDFNQGLDIRLITSDVIRLLSQIRVERLHFAWDDPKQDLEPYFEKFANEYPCKDHRRKIVYVLTNYGSTMEENLHRIYTLERLGFDADVRVFDKPNAPKEVKRLQRWCNNRIIHGVCKRFEDYKD